MREDRKQLPFLHDIFPWEEEIPITNARFKKPSTQSSLAPPKAINSFSSNLTSQEEEKEGALAAAWKLQLGGFLLLLFPAEQQEGDGRDPI